MKLRTFILAGSLGLLACMAGKQPQDAVRRVVAKYPAVIQDVDDKDEPPVLPLVVDSFYVSIDLIVFQKEIDRYPETWENFNAAIQEWSQHVPVRWVVFNEDHDLPYSLKGRIHAIEVHLADLQGISYGMPDELLGLWDSGRSRILLDADSLENNPNQAYSVSLHEIGHMLGVPHVVGFDDVGNTGFVVLPKGYDAPSFVMYPHAVKGQPKKALSTLEIGFAFHHLLHYWTRPNVQHQTQDCHFSLDNEH